MIGVPICTLVVFAGWIVLVGFFVRKAKMKSESDESSQPVRSALRIEFADDTVDDSVTTYSTTTTYDPGSEILMGIPGEFGFNVTTTLY
jgi:hypothetical protein